MIKGNKGEWSELYTLVKVLADGQLHQSDTQLKIDPENVYIVCKAYKKELDYDLQFDRLADVELYRINSEGKSHINSFTVSELNSIASELYHRILEGRGLSFPIIELTPFFDSTGIQRIKAGSMSKSDIKLRIYDHRLAKETDLGFSIKSLLGGNSTLFNTGKGNNFIYKVETEMDESIQEFNRRTYKAPGGVSKLTYRIGELVESNSKFNFWGIESSQLYQNLRFIDGDLPSILAWSLYYRWLYRTGRINKIVEILEENDPLSFYQYLATPQKFYEQKLKKFLTEAAMGMTSETPWIGEYDSFGGVIVVKEDGNLVCFNIYDFNLFQDYLINNTSFEQASTGEDSSNPGNPKSGGKNFNYGWLYEEDGANFFKINLQVRFNS